MEDNGTKVRKNYRENYQKIRKKVQEFGMDRWHDLSNNLALVLAECQRFVNTVSCPIFVLIPEL